MVRSNGVTFNGIDDGGETMKLLCRLLGHKLGRFRAVMSAG